MTTNIKFDFDKKLEDYTPEEVKFLDQMHQKLTEFNASIPEEYEGEINYPSYSQDEKLSYSHYRQLLISAEVSSI